MPQVTVILPTWNREKWLKTSIESVLSQTFQDFELIVVDDASTDSTGKILESYSGKIRTPQSTQNPEMSETVRIQWMFSTILHDSRSEE